jgi:hypothetical protein
MSMLDVAIVPPHLTVLSMRMAVALYVTGISTPEVHPEFPPRCGTLTRFGATGLTFYDDEVERFFSPDAAGKGCMLIVAVGSSPRLNKDGVSER